jgi:photosystem II stability/assembly factor-like uncharacterized protein
MRRKSALAAAVVLVTAWALAGRQAAQGQALFNEHLLEAFTYRNMGPFRMGARTSAIAVPASPAKDHLYTFYVSFWTGGLWKTTNNGTTFEPLFDGQSRLAIGDVKVAPSNPDVVWVGTGDAFTSRSSFAGDGLYKSTDAGKTWKNMGLRDSHHIARIAIDPTNPNIVYVAAMGHLYSENAERGVFKTVNGGESWEKILYVSEKVGVIDLVLNPRNPAVLYAATYDKQRLPWQMVNGGPGSGIYKTSDSGRTWTRLEGGLPTGRIGRIGLDIFLGNPDILYAVIENENPRPAGGGGPGNGPPSAGGTYGGQVYRTENAGQAWTKMTADDYNVSPKGPYYFSQIRVDPGNDKNIFVTQDGFRHSLDGGKTWSAPPVFPRMFGDVRTLWIDPENPDRMIQGSDGGIAISYDGGKTSDAYSNIPVGEVYSISTDMEDPYNIYAGLQDHEHWRGPSNTASGRVTINDWVALGNGDGIVAAVDPKDSRWVYTTREYGGHARLDQKLGYTTNIVPQRLQGDPYRFIWETPLVISRYDSRVLYTGGQVLLRSTDRGDHWTEISPDLSTNDTAKIMRESEGSVPGGIPWFAISSISESPLARGIIWAGTSDGKVHVTRSDGATWADVTTGISAAGGREDAYVSRVRASAHVVGRAYVSKSGYKFDDFRPYLYRTEDFGATWTSIASSLPNAPINVIYEDLKNPDLLFVGNDTGVFVSLNRGANWVKMNNNMPNISVHDLLVHPRENDLILGSYGRDLWITNIGPLQEMNDAVLAEDVHLFSIKPMIQRVTWSFGANDYLFGQRHVQTPNEQNAMAIRYYLKNPATGGVSVVIADAAGQEVARLPGRTAAGINTVLWTMRAPGGRGTGGAGGARGAAGTGGAGGGGRGGGAGPGTAAPVGGGRGNAAGASVLDQLAPLGDYTVTLEVGGKTFTEKARITATQGWSMVPVPQIIR